jgi:hypothetical protein
MVASTVFFACSDVITKALASSLPAVEIAWLRYVTFSALVAPLRRAHPMALVQAMRTDFGHPNSSMRFKA